MSCFPILKKSKALLCSQDRIALAPRASPGIPPEEEFALPLAEGRHCPWQLAWSAPYECLNSRIGHIAPHPEELRWQARYFLSEVT
ncbi:hypothetical protein SAMN05519104_7928 [Rhizobiales bacterium GAS188]|nr:hypothetical protein SAMN05519104_7928 [Rhizobiales bacterium GAS188]